MQIFYDDEPKLSKEDLNKALRGRCPCCPVGLVIETKIDGESDIWKLRCNRCHFFAYYDFGGSD